MYSTRNDSPMAMKTLRSINVSRARHGIDAVTSQRMAAREPPNTEPHPSGRAVNLDGFAHIVGTRGIETAGASEERRKKYLIASQQREDGCGG